MADMKTFGHLSYRVATRRQSFRRPNMISIRLRRLYRRVLSGIIFINRNGLRWRDAPKEYGPPKTLYNRWKRWSDKGVFARMMDGLAAEAAVPKTVMIDATYLKAHRTATSLRSKKGGMATREAV